MAKWTPESVEKALDMEAARTSIYTDFGTEGDEGNHYVQLDSRVEDLSDSWFASEAREKYEAQVSDLARKYGVSEEEAWAAVSVRAIAEPGGWVDTGRLLSDNMAGVDLIDEGHFDGEPEVQLPTDDAAFLRVAVEARLFEAGEEVAPWLNRTSWRLYLDPDDLERENNPAGSKAWRLGYSASVAADGDPAEATNPYKRGSQKWKDWNAGWNAHYEEEWEQEGYESVTEAHEAGSDRAAALANYTEKYQEFKAGQETMGVVDMYEKAALDAGVSEEALEQVRRRSNPRGRLPADSHTAHSLWLHIMNTHRLYKKLPPYWKTLAKKKEQGTYRTGLAWKAFMPLINEVMREDVRAPGARGKWREYAAPATRELAAQLLVEDFEGRYDTGEVYEFF